MEKRTTEHGYIEVHLPEHPLSRKGWCYEHRAVLFDAMPGDQPCYWCGWLMPWQGGQKICINVDHLNEVRTDNRVTNLVPSCWWCNVNRSWSRIAPLLWQRAKREFGSLPPDERPNMIHWLAARAEEGIRPQRNDPVVAPKDPVTGRAVLGRAAVRSHHPHDDWLGRITHDHVLNPRLPDRSSERYGVLCERWADHLARAVYDKVITEQEAKAAWDKYTSNLDEIDLSELTDQANQ